MIDLKSPATWEKGFDRKLHEFYRARINLCNDNDTIRTNQFLAGLSPRTAVTLIAQEMAQQYYEPATRNILYANAFHQTAFARILLWEKPKQLKLITEQPRPSPAMTTPQRSPLSTSPATSPASPIMLLQDMYSVYVYAFLHLLYENDGPERTLTKILIKHLQKLPLIHIDNLTQLITTSITRVLYDLFYEEDHGTPQYDITIDPYFQGAQCAVGNSILPGVISTIPQVVKFLESLPWPVHVGLPGAMFLLGQLINEIICIDTGWHSRNRVAIEDENYPLPTRAQLVIYKRQWIMLVITIFGTLAETVAPYLRLQVLPSLMPAATAAAVTSLPVTLGIIGASGYVAYLIATHMQARNRLQQAPLAPVIKRLSQFANWCGTGCCFPSLCGESSYAPVPPLIADQPAVSTDRVLPIGQEPGQSDA